jgi:uncharacterized membrane protein
MLLATQVANPFVYNSHLASLALSSLLLVTCIPAIKPSLRLRFGATLGLVVVLSLRFAEVQVVPRSAGLSVFAFLCTAIYVAFVAVNVFAAVIRRTRVNTNTVIGAICVYLMMAHVFALVYLALEVHAPGSISGVSRGVEDGGQNSHLHGFLYFSVITLTTLGYGDMVATTPIARALVMLEAMGGQFFVAVFVARLVGSWSPAGPQGRDPAA